MFESNFTNQYCVTQGMVGKEAQANRINHEAFQLYYGARRRSLINRVLARLTGRSRSLLSLSALGVNCQPKNRSSIGIKTVRISQIRGSENRTEDFDASFSPLKANNRERWVSVARAYIQDVTLPAIELIQVGDYYYIRDGHHRVSVARAVGQEAIEANVTVWQGVCLPLDPQAAKANGLVTGTA